MPWLKRLSDLLRPRKLDAELEEEMQFHLAARIRDNAAAGMSPEEARRQARLAFGARDKVSEECRESRDMRWLETAWRDLRYALRVLRGSPVFTLTAVGSLALGIGANVAVFSIVNAILLRELPFRDPSQLVWIANVNEDHGLSGVTYRVDIYEEFRRRSRTFEDMTAYFAFFGFGSFKWTGHGEPERLAGVDVAPNFFTVLGVRPLLGRLFTAEEANGGVGAVLLAHGLWKRRFASDPAVVGRSLHLNGRAVTVVGVLPASFDFSSVFAPGTRVEIIKPARLEGMRNWGNTLSIIGRLKPGTQMEQAREEFKALLPQLNAAHPEWGDGYGARLTPLDEQVNGRIRHSLLVLWLAVGVVLLIVCTNLCNLMLARASARSKEIAIRSALGAGRSRILFQLLAENLLLSLGGAVIGLALAVAAIRAVISLSSVSIPLLGSVRVDLSAAILALALALVSGLLFGAWPAFRLSAAHLEKGLKESGRGSSDGAGRAWLRSALAVAQVSLACVLLVGAGLLLRSFVAVLDVDLGFRPSQAIAVRVDPPADATRPQRQAYFDSLLRAVQAVPGIQAAGLTDALPLDRNRSWDLQAAGRTYPPGFDTGALIYVISGGYLGAMGIPLRSGRAFQSRDTAEAEQVILINETAARIHWPGEDAVGKLALIGRPKPYRVVGVVADLRNRALEEASGCEFYRPIQQESPASTELIFRTSLDVASISSGVRAALRSIEPNMPPSDFRPLQRLIDRAVSPRRFFLTLLAGFAAAALLLASIGIYGVISISVAQRGQEIGIRMALGATASAIRFDVMRQTLALAMAGLAIGTIVSLASTKLVGALLFGITPTDPLTFLAMIVILLVMSFAAAWVPARRASRVDPVLALRGLRT